MGKVRAYLIYWMSTCTPINRIKAANQMLKEFSLLVAMLLPFIGCNQDAPVHVKDLVPAVKIAPSLQLNFTSGIKSMFEDSKGNYWLGSSQEGVAVFDGHTLSYFTINEGLPDNQIRSIKEDNDGNIWLGTADGVSRYDGEKITNYTPRINSGSSSEWGNTDNKLWLNTGQPITKQTLTASNDLPSEWMKTANDIWFNAGTRKAYTDTMVKK